MTQAPPRHPAKFTDVILERAADLLDQQVPLWRYEHTLFDPFAGTGKGVEYMRARGWTAFGMELEPEWALQSGHVLVGDSLVYMLGHPESVDVIFTSPAYGNRMADHHEARDASRRNTYTHALGRKLSPSNAGSIQWGKAYRDFHRMAWERAYNMLKPGGLFLLNIKDHIRKGERQYVPEWHHETLLALGFECVTCEPVKCPGNRQGQNGQVRVDHEWLYLYRKPE